VFIFVYALLCVPPNHGSVKIDIFLW